ncbi:MAG TPA: hypothetical protein VHQ45_14550 [Gemmatimonadaceae bacterium]|nr:hypothetical protein [Gemmatimonadaceae bacterium]
MNLDVVAHRRPSALVVMTPGVPVRPDASRGLGRERFAVEPPCRHDMPDGDELDQSTITGKPL